MTFEQFMQRVDDTFMSCQAARSKPNELISVSNQLRYGQALMNVLYDIWPEKYFEISNSDIDCFYTNRSVALVLNKLESEWNEYTRT